MINSAEEFIKLRSSEDMEEYQRAAWDDIATEICFEIIIKYPEMKFWVAHNKKVPLEVLEFLADDEDSRVRGMVASKNRISELIQHKLVYDADELVRQRLVFNKKVNLKTLEILSNDEVDEIRMKAQKRLRTRRISEGGC